MRDSDVTNQVSRFTIDAGVNCPDNFVNRLKRNFTSRLFRRLIKRLLLRLCRASFSASQSLFLLVTIAFLTGHSVAR